THHKVDVFGLLARQRRLDARIELHWPEVDVLIQLEPQLQQQTFLQDARRHVGVADSAQEDGVELPQFVDGAFGKDFACPQVAVAAEIKLLKLDRESFQLGDGL